MVGRVLGTLLTVSAIAAPALASGRIPRDAIDLSQVHVYSSPPDVASWPVTTAITQLNVRPTGDPLEGVSMTFSAQQTWPDTTTGFTGLQYTIWPVWYAAGQWNTAGIIQMWRGRPDTGASLLSGFALYWIYSSRWGPGYGHQPQVGEQMGFFVTAGNARDVSQGSNSVMERSNVVMISVPANDYGSFTFPATVPIRTVALDVDGDGRSEIAVYRPATGQWLGLFSSTNYTSWASLTWGAQGDVPVPGDYDGDGRTDVAVYRPSSGQWLISLSSTRFSTSVVYSWGASTDIPIPGDYDGDGITDPAVYRPSTGQWLILKSSSNFSAWSAYQWGVSGDVPVPNDYDGDGKADLALFRPSNGGWLIALSSTNFGSTVVGQWGMSGDVPLPGDYDGDGKADLVVYRASSNTWYVSHSSTNYSTWTAYQWGVSGDMPVTGDFDGDGRTDIGVYRPSAGVWLILKSSTNYGGWFAVNWGAGGDAPLFVRQ